MRQMYGDRQLIPVLPLKPPPDPAGIYGADMTNFTGAMKLAKLVVKANVVGGTSTNLFLYALDSNDNSWSLVSDVGNLGQLGGLTLPAGDEYIFTLHDLGWVGALALVERNAVGATASLALNSAGLSVNWNTVVAAVAPGGSGNLVQVQLVPSNAVPKAGTLVEENDNGVMISTFTYLPGVSQVSDMETLITGTPSKLLVRQTPGTGANVLQTSDAFGPAPLAGGTPVTTATLIELIENNFRRPD